MPGECEPLPELAGGPYHLPGRRGGRNGAEGGAAAEGGPEMEGVEDL